MRSKLHILFFLLFSLICGNSHFLLAKDAWKKGDRDLIYGIGANLRPSYVMPTHGFYNGWNQAGKPIRTGGMADVQFVISSRNRGVSQGVGLAVQTFGAHDMLGTPTALYIFQGAPLVYLTDALSLGYEWNLGVSAGWRNNGIVTVSPINVYINVAALFTWSITPYWKIIWGPEYTHYSNGDTRFPNGGANTVNLRIGARRNFTPASESKAEKIFADDMPVKGFADRIACDLVFLGGFRSDRSVSNGMLHIFNKSFPMASVNVNPQYRINSYFSAGPSLDMLYDRSANLEIVYAEDEEASYRYPDFRYQTSLGVSARLELKMPVFAVNIGIGYGFHLGDHTRYENPDLNGLYGIFALKAFLSERIFLNVSYKLNSVLYSHSLMFGLGWRFGNLTLHP